jgi:predicted tellurium resistance membrane protein TerC
MQTLLTVNNLTSLVTLTGMEIVLGIDNIIFISILVSKVPKEQQSRTRRIGLGLALITRLALLFSLTAIMKLKFPLFTIVGKNISAKDLILICGGLFLVAKATFEIHDKLESASEAHTVQKMASPPKYLLIQIALLDIVFSLDSVITAVGMAQHLWVMVIAVIFAVGIMLFAAGVIGEFVEQHPTIKILALAFLILIGVTLLIEGMGGHVPKGYIYFAIFFSLGVEFLNIRFLRKQGPIKIYSSKVAESEDPK